MKKITKENKNFQKSFFHSLKEYQNEIKTMESQRDVVREDVEDSSNKQPKVELMPKKSPLKLIESPKKIILNTHIGELLSDVDSVINFIYLLEVIIKYIRKNMKEGRHIQAIASRK